jgi:hypothetical protein
MSKEDHDKLRIFGNDERKSNKTRFFASINMTAPTQSFSAEASGLFASSQMLA